MQIVHLSTVHPRFDSRIFLKQCRSLVCAGHTVYFLVADGQGDQTCESVAIRDVGSFHGRINRILNATRAMRDYALNMDADIYHLHDPELLTIAGALRRAGKLVVFDAHEDLPKQVLGKPYLHKALKRPLSFVLKWYEKIVCRKLSGVVTATPYIRDKFLQINAMTVDVNNYPILDELVSIDANVKSAKDGSVCYIGGLSRQRGIKELLLAVNLTANPVQLKLAGSFTDLPFKEEVKGLLGYPSVYELGWLDRVEIKELLRASSVGMVTLQPLVNYLDSLPIKMFEYMSAGVPVIASDFPLWKTIVEQNQCGLCVDPLSPQDIAKAIDFLLDNPEKSKEMGQNGMRAIREKYNWETEFLKLESLYENVKGDAL